MISSATAPAASACGDVTPATVVAADGAVEIRAADGQRRSAALGMAVCAGETVVTGPTGRVELRLAAVETTLGLAPNAELRIPAGESEAERVSLIAGVLRFLSSVRDVFTVETRHATAGIDGTEAVIATAPEGTVIAVREGDVRMTPESGGVSRVLAAGTAGFTAAAGEVTVLGDSDARALPPRLRAVAIDVAGASDWAIYYPPILLAPDNAPQAIGDAARALDAGDPDAAERLLAAAGEAPEALALGAVIAIARGRTAEGAKRAEQARAAAPDLAAAHLAVSYAAQAAGDIPGARAAAAVARRLAPDDPFAAARVAELSFIAGDAPRAERQAREALAVGESSLAQAILGLARLAASDYDGAATAFRAGIALDSEDPLPRLGLGLLFIRQGDVAEGRRELETAAALSPRRGLFRTELGRAYAQEYLGEKALAQYALARAADPDDPAPWLLQAETLFLDNRMIGALDAAREAVARAGARETVRTQRGLAEDRGRQGAVLSRVLSTLGFKIEALQAGTAAAEGDPTNPGAHGAVADLLRLRKRQEIAAVSAALAEQVWRRPSKQTLDPLRTETALAALDAPAIARPSLFALEPFFEADGGRLIVSGFGGTQERLGGTVSGAYLAGGWSAATAVSHAQDDGFRFNNDASSTVVSTEIRGQIGPRVDVFAEYRYRQSDFGDRILSFDLLDGDPTQDQDLERNLVRGGLTARVGEKHDVAAVLTYTREQSSLFTTPELFGFPTPTTATAEGDAYDVQVQHVGRFGPLTTISGITYAESDVVSVIGTEFFGFPLPPITVPEETEQLTAYAYGIWRSSDLPLVSDAELTIGLSLDRFERAGDVFAPGSITTSLNPKAGLRVGVTDALDLRAAFTRVVTPNDISQQRLEPVTVAGLSQFSDQPGGARVMAGGGGFTLRVFDWLSLDGEAVRRRITFPGVAPADSRTREIELRGAVNAVAGPQWALGIEGVRLDSDADGQPDDLPSYEVSEIAGRVTWFHPSGFFAGARGGWVWHDVVTDSESGSDDFPILDLIAGFRLPRRRGVLSLELQNAADASFGFADRPTLPNGEVAVPRFARDFTALGRFTLNFER